MAAVPISAGGASLCTVRPDNANRLQGDLFCGETTNPIFGGAACYIKASDGKVYLSHADTANAEACKVHGFAAGRALYNEPVTLYYDVAFAYSDGNLTPGQSLYVTVSTGAGAGALDSAPTTGNGAVPVAFAIDKWRISVNRKPSFL